MKPTTGQLQLIEYHKSWLSEKEKLPGFHPLFNFNPNSISEESLDSLPIPEYIKQNILKYRKAGGKFRTCSDVRKIYGMNDSILKMIEPFLLLPGEDIPEPGIEAIVQQGKNEMISDEFQGVHARKGSREKIIVELNKADSVELVKLKGIGPVFASRIIKYRNLLGGFYSNKQLHEVYGLPEETFHYLRNITTADTLHIEKIRINFADYRLLIRHPYMKKEHVEAILNFRQNNGPFSSSEQLLFSKLIDSVTYRKMIPYITCR